MSAGLASAGEREKRRRESPTTFGDADRRGVCGGWRGGAGLVKLSWESVHRPHSDLIFTTILLWVETMLAIRNVPLSFTLRGARAG